MVILTDTAIITANAACRCFGITSFDTEAEATVVGFKFCWDEPCYEVETSSGGHGYIPASEVENGNCSLSKQ